MTERIGFHLPDFCGGLGVLPSTGYGPKRDARAIRGRSAHGPDTFKSMRTLPREAAQSA
jgi:hypothetical protein